MNWRSLPAFLLVLVLVLAACSTDAPVATERDPQPFEAAIGTLSYGSRIGASFMFRFDLEAVPEEGVEVVIQGPASWNGGDPVRRIYRYTTPGVKATWLNVFSDASGAPLEAVTGAYTVSATVNGQPMRESLHLDATATLPRPQALTVLTSGSTSVSLEWEAVPGAASYMVELFGDTAEESGYVYTQSPDATLSGLALKPGVTYRIGVNALNADFSGDDPRRVPEVFNTSFASTRFTLE